MSEFDFLSSAAIGQYIPTGSVLHKLEPRTKLIGFIILILAVTFSRTAQGIGVGLLAAIFGLLIARVPIRFALKGLLYPLPFLVIIAILQVFLYPGLDTVPIFVIGPLRLTMAGIWSCVLIILRFIALILSLSLLSYCLSTSEMIHGLQKLLSPLNRLGIHAMDLVMVVQVSLRFLPFLAQSAERIAKAQASRGAEWGVKSRGLISRVKQVVPLIIPLITTSLQRAETMALAMDARVYGYKDERTSMFVYTFNWRDALFLLFVVLIALAVFFI